MSYNNFVRAAEQAFLLPKLNHIARLAISSSCWLFSQAINCLRIAGWALFKNLKTKGGEKEK
ncbi:MAG: hypothetical protein MUP17_12985 [candidate division Zixibacteria bacterium]|nr:hypothetical protein [candidate division Zixibacteria bacterium]